MLENRLIREFEKSIINNWDLPAFTNFKKDTVTYGQVAQRIKWIHSLFEEINIHKGDKIALIGRNLNNWAITYIATISYGAVIVPILPDFNSSDIHHIINHSESKLLFSTENLFNKIDDTKISKVRGIVSLNDFSMLADCGFDLENAIDKADKLLENKPAEKTYVKYYHCHENDMAVLSYTSGSSGFSKGVMLPYRSIYSNIKIGIDYINLEVGDKVVSFLPLAHVFGCAFEFLTEFCVGCEIVFLSRVPSPQIITKAFREVKPKLICSVPLIMEKIYKKKILPVLEKKSIKLMLKVPLLERKIYNKINNELTETFGGNFNQVIIGGAPLNSDVEAFLKKIGFKFTVGYGMTECGPLISYSEYSEHKKFSCGEIVDRMEAKIDSPDPYNIPGEVIVKGDNVMLGYFKNQEATKEVLDEEGWLHTGDMGVLDKGNHLSLRGRTKNMILGPSGQNIYPEEIEARLNNMPFIQETVVTDDKYNKLIALAYPDYEMCDEQGMGRQDIELAFDKSRQILNRELPAYMQVSKIELYPEEFKKTPKRNIKRYLYTNTFK